MDRIVNQLKDYCDCLPDDIEDFDFTKLVKEMIDIISALTCWQEQTCETFLQSERTEYIENIPSIPCDCCSSGIIPELFIKIFKITFWDYIIKIKYISSLNFYIMAKSYLLAERLSKKGRTKPISNG